MEVRPTDPAFDISQPRTNSDLAGPPVIDLFGRVIREINRKLGSGLAYNQILDFLFESLGVLIPFDRMGIALLDEKSGLLRSSWMKSKIKIQHLNRNYSAPVAGSTLQRILETGEPRIINNLRDYLTSHPNSTSTKLILRDGILSSLTCPLLANDKPVGLVFFSSCKVDTYKSEHVEVFSAIAAELSVIVEQARLRRYFEESHSKAKSFSTVIHDLRCPLSVIQGFLEMVVDEHWYKELPPEAENIFEVLSRNTTYMFNLIDELSELELVNAQTDFIRQPVNLMKFCSEMAEHGKRLAGKKGILFEVTLDPHLPPIAHFDSGKIRRVFDNLISNAVKFSERGTTIKMEANHTRGRLEFSFIDQGRGIAESEVPKLFLEFGKTSTLPTEGERSTGLGLAIAKAMVERHGGQISLRTKLNEGSTFSFWIPVLGNADS